MLMDKRVVLVLLGLVAVLYAAPVLLYPLLPPGFLDAFGSVTGFRVVAMAFLLGVTTGDISLGTPKAKAERVEEDEDPEPAPVKPASKFGNFKEEWRAKRSPSPEPEPVKIYNGGAELEALRSEIAELKQINRALLKPEEPPKPVELPPTEAEIEIIRQMRKLKEA